MVTATDIEGLATVTQGNEDRSGGARAGATGAGVRAATTLAGLTEGTLAAPPGDPVRAYDPLDPSDGYPRVVVVLLPREDGDGQMVRTYPINVDDLGTAMHAVLHGAIALLHAEETPEDAAPGDTDTLEATPPG